MRPTFRCFCGLLAAVIAAGLVSLPVAAQDDMPVQLRDTLTAAMQDYANQFSKERDEEGKQYKRLSYSRRFAEVDGDTYLGSAHLNTALGDTQRTERYTVTLSRKGDRFEVTDSKLEESMDLLKREEGLSFHDFSGVSFDRGGLRITGGAGSLYAAYLDGHVTWFRFTAADLAYDYTGPQQQDYYQLNRFIEADYSQDLLFSPDSVTVRCSAGQCSELLSTMFTGMSSPPDGVQVDYKRGALPSSLSGRIRDLADKDLRETQKELGDNTFYGFRRPTREGNEWWQVAVNKNENHAVWLTYDNWGGYEYVFGVFRDGPGLGPQGPVFSYFSDETRESTPAYDLERRDDKDARWYHLYKVDGLVQVALEDPEKLRGDITYGLELKRDTRELPFFIATIPAGGADEETVTNPTLFVNSIRHDGSEMTWVRTGPFSGIAMLPEVMPAGTRIELEMDFESRVIFKVNHAYSAMARGGWLPFVRFGDMIDQFQLEVHTPAKYDVLGIGRRTFEEKRGDVLVTRWVADSPVVFPTIIFGKYYTDSPKIMATKADGTEIPVTVNVDEVSMGMLTTNAEGASGGRGIRGKQLRPIGDQAVNSINYYRELSGLDYPYGELNIVNDPSPALYGQAPSSLIYLGSFVFRGEGAIAGGAGAGGGTGTAKFLKSVVAHEVGHQWWGSRIANANTRNYWFVESLAEYFSALWLEVVHGRDEYMEQVEEWKRRVIDIDQRASVHNAPVQWGGEISGAAYQAAVYNKGPYAFHILRSTFGDEKFIPAMKTFSMALAEKGEIVTLDIQQALEAALGGVGPDGNPYNVDLSWFFDQWINGAGLPQYSFNWSTRQAEDGTWIVEGTIKQRVVVGNKSKFHVLDNHEGYRGLVSVTVVGDDKQEYPVRFPVEGAETPFAFKVPVEPFDVVLNKDGEMLAMETLVNRDF